MTTAQHPRFTKHKLYTRGWTISEAAEHIGITRSHLARILSGERESKRVMMQIAKLPQKEINLHRTSTH